MRIMIVDDEFVSRKKAEKILSNFGKCEVVSSGQQAFEAYRSSLEEGAPFDVVTMDIMMPGMDGIQTLEKIRKLEEERNILLGKGVKVVMLTVSDAPKKVTRSFFSGCEAYILKPFNREKLETALKELELF